MRTLIIAVLLFIAACSPAYAWHAAGHKMTAEIAFNQLATEQQQKFVEVLRAHPRFTEDFQAAMPHEIKRGTAKEQGLWLFQHASIWPDLVPGISESVRNQYHRGTWHYINLPVFLTQDDQDRLAGRLGQNMSFAFEPPLRPGLNIIQALNGNLLVWQDDAASNADKAVALCWILHLTGDLHQPLHTVALFSEVHFAEGDRGGNLIRIRHDPKPTNLHAVWDGLPTNISDWRPSPSALELLANEDVAYNSIISWAQVHKQLAVDYVYTPTLKASLLEGLAEDDQASMELSAAYLGAARGLARVQVIAAGYRIAALLQH